MLIGLKWRHIDWVQLACIGGIGLIKIIGQPFKTIPDFIGVKQIGKRVLISPGADFLPLNCQYSNDLIAPAGSDSNPHQRQ